MQWLRQSEFVAEDAGFAPFSPDLPFTRLTQDLAGYLRGGLYEVEGWGIDDFLAHVFVRLDKFHEIGRITGNLFEIGVHHGRSAILLALLAKPGERTVCMDLFERQAENIDSSGRGNREMFEANLRRWASRCEVEIVQANTLEADFAAVPGLSGGVRFAHIDGGHYREVVLNDLMKTEQILCDGGVVVMDDFCHMEFPEVSEACNHYLENVEQRRLAPVAIGHNKLVLTTRNMQERLVAFLHHAGKFNAPLFGPVVRYHGHQVVSLGN